jgi:hypothetical protein
MVRIIEFNKIYFIFYNLYNTQMRNDKLRQIITVWTYKNVARNLREYELIPKEFGEACIYSTLLYSNKAVRC